jgi:hypothetical protein
MKYLVCCLLVLSSCRKTTTTNCSCNENVSSEEKLLAFIGERISVKTLPIRENLMETKFLAEYKILEKLCGHYKGDTIKFEIVNWIVDTSFKKNKHILVFLVKNKAENEDYWMRGYLYFDLFKTKDGEWASPYPSEYYSDDVSLETTTIRPRKIAFVQEVSFDLDGMDKMEVTRRFPEPYYKIQNNKALAVYGNYAGELLQLQKDGVLRHWGLFGIRDTVPELEEVDLEEIQ